MPNFITAFRLVFFTIFVWAAHEGLAGWAAALFLIAWILDAVDGWAARKLGQETEFGFIFDKAVDRLVVFGGLVIMLFYRLVPDITFLVLVKDVAMAPGVSVKYAQGGRVLGAGKLGKAAAVFQGVGIMWALLGLPYVVIVIAGVALVGGLAGWLYVRRVYGGETKNRAAAR